QARPFAGLYPGRIGEPDLVGGVQLLSQVVGVLRLGRHEIAVQPREVAGDGLGGADRLDAVDRGGLALVPEPRVLAAGGLDHLVEVVVDLEGQVGGGAGGHAAAEPPAVDDHHAPAGAGEFVGGGEAGDTGAYHQDVRLGIGRQGGEV